MQMAVEKALSWGRAKGLTFSSSKTVAVLFTNKRKFLPPPKIRMEGAEIPYSDSVQYLGVRIDKGLTWKEHLRHKTKVVKAHVIKLKNAMGKLWGLPPKLMRWAYTGIVRPRLSYGALVWSKACNSSWAVKELTKINRLALLSMGHFRRSTPTAGLEIISDVMPLHLYIQGEAALAYSRTEGQTKMPRGHFQTSRTTLKGHREICKDFLGKANINIPVCDVIPPVRCWNHLHTLNQASFLKGKPLEKAEYGIYTDGSFFQGGTSSGFCVYKEGRLKSGHSYHLGHEATVFQAEVYAIKKAALWIIERKTKWCIFTIHSDSRAALLALSSNSVSSAVVRETIGYLRRAATRNGVNLRWVKAHVGHEGNEKADELAKEGATNPQLLVDDPPLLAKTVAKRTITEGFYEIWKRTWQARTDCRQTKIWFPEPDKGVSFKLLQLDRRTFSSAAQLITGHNFMNRHQALVDKTTDPECRYCMEDDESSFHIIGDCPAFAVQRWAAFGAFTLTHPLKWSPAVLTFIRNTQIEHLLDLVQEDPEGQ